MKKLLLVISICVSLITFGCNNSHSNTSEVKIEDSIKVKIDTPQVVITAAPVAQDTPHIGGKIGEPKTVGLDKGVKKDTVKKVMKGNAIIHSSPDQAKIDSIKNAKLKLKK